MCITLTGWCIVRRRRANKRAYYHKDAQNTSADGSDRFLETGYDACALSDHCLFLCLREMSEQRLVFQNSARRTSTHCAVALPNTYDSNDKRSVYTRLARLVVDG